MPILLLTVLQYLAVVHAASCYTTVQQSASCSADAARQSEPV